MTLQSIIRVCARSHPISSLLKERSASVVFQPRIFLPAIALRPAVDIVSRPISTEAFDLKSRDGFGMSAVKKVKLYFRKYKLRAAGFQLYEAVADHIDYDVFMTKLDLPDTFYSWYLITELHVWMLMARLMANPYDGRAVRNFVVEALWKDVTTRSKKLGSEHLSIVRKQIYEMNEGFQAALVLYDEGLLRNDKVLASALWRRLYSQNCNSAVQLEAMVHYVRRSMRMLDKIEIEDLIKSKQLDWPPIDQVIQELREK